MLDRETILSAIATHCRALTEGDREAWLSIWADDVVLEDPVGVDTYRGIETLGGPFWDIIESISPMKLWQAEEVIVCGNEAIVILSALVTRDGQEHPVGPIVDHFTFGEDGKAVSMRAFWKYD